MQLLKPAFGYNPSAAACLKVKWLSKNQPSPSSWQPTSACQLSPLWSLESPLPVRDCCVFPFERTVLTSGVLTHGMRRGGNTWVAAGVAKSVAGLPCRDPPALPCPGRPIAPCPAPCPLSCPSPACGWEGARRCHTHLRAAAWRSPLSNPLRLFHPSFPLVSKSLPRTEQGLSPSPAGLLFWPRRSSAERSLNRPRFPDRWHCFSLVLRPKFKNISVKIAAPHS